MSDDSPRPATSSESWGDDISRLAVAAHSLLGGVAAVRGALSVAMQQPQETHVDSVLALAARRLDRMAEELRDLALGLPGPPVTIDLHETPRSRWELTGGTEIEVHSSFNNTWTPGFEIVETVIGGYRVRRASDHSVLPGLVASSDVRMIAHPSFP